MIVLRDTVEVHASREQVFDFLVRFEENYLTWHPDHVKCRYLRGLPAQEGSVLYIEEYLHGKLHKLKFKITKLEPNSRMEYKIMFGTRGAFIVEQKGSNSLFTAEIYIGTEIPFLRNLLDRLLSIVLSRQLEDFRRHMAEEGQNLKRIVEEVVH